MITTLDIITASFREANLIPVGQPPSDDELAEALVRYNALVSSVYGFEVGEELVDWPVQGGPTNGLAHWTAAEWQYPLPNTRILANLNSPDMVFLPAFPGDGARIQIIDVASNFSTVNFTIDPNGRKFNGQLTPTIFSEDSFDKTFIYRAEKVDWIPLQELIVTDEFPFPSSFQDSFITLLAVRMNPRYGQGITEATIATLERAVEQLRARYRQRVVVTADLGVRNLTGTRSYGKSEPHRSFP